MRNKDKVLDDLRNVQSRDSSSVVKARVSIGRISAMAKQKIASRKRPYGAKKVVPIERPKVDVSIHSFESTSTCTSTCTISHRYRGDNTISNTTSTCTNVSW